MQPIRSIYADDPDMRDLVMEFVSEVPGRVRCLEEMLESADLTALQRLAHQLKGAGGGYGFPQITEAAAALELGLREGCDATIVKDRTRALCDVLRAVTVLEGA
jgi:HPt (histidine-containing phosphotransfer) domain-containing protein